MRGPIAGTTGAQGWKVLLCPRKQFFGTLGLGLEILAIHTHLNGVIRGFISYGKAPKGNMIYLVLIVALVLLAYGPALWVRWVLQKHHKPMANMPGTGGELALHLIERFQLEGVSVQEGRENEDHYNPATKAISLSPRVFHGKSLSAVAVATHEVGHAIQFFRNEPVSHLREKYLGHAHRLQQAGIFILMAMPVVGAIFRLPHLALLTAGVGIATMLVSVLMYVAILPEEYDASFNKALPILSEGYVPEENMPAVRQVLKAAAFTYVAAALADILRLWRWLAILR